jgi:hypothetical protein
MRTIRQHILTPQFVEFMPEVKEPNILYISKRFNLAIYLCDCGCNGQNVLPLSNSGIGHTWKCTEQDGKVSLMPSILNNVCGTHGVLTNNIVNII